MKMKDEGILSQLHSDKYVTSSEIGAALGVSEKTVRTRIKELNAVIQQNGAVIRSKRSAGYAIEIVDNKRYREFLDQSSSTGFLFDEPVERVHFLLWTLIRSDEYLKIDQLMDEVFVSRNTLTSDLKRVEEILKSYRLILRRRPKYGIRVTGEEYDKRICVFNSVIKDNDLNLRRVKEKEDVVKIAAIVREALDRNKILMTPSSFDDFVVLTNISKDRIQTNHWIEMNPDRVSSHDHISLQLSRCADEIVGRLSSSFDIDYSFAEKEFLTILLAGKSGADSFNEHPDHLIISTEIDSLVLKILVFIYQNNGIDFRNNLDLRMALNQHMVPFDIRVRYNIPLVNPLLEKIKKDYTFAYTIAQAACTVISDYYGVNIVDDEVGYFAILFALEIEKRDVQIKKKNIVMVCVSGRGSAQFFLYRYKQAFGKYIENIYECSVYDLKTFDFKGKAIDYLFTTIPLQVKVPVPICQISIIMDPSEVLNYSRLFEHGDTGFVHEYYFRELFLCGLKADTREAVLKMMCNHIGKYRKIPEGFYESVLKREEMGKTDFGNLVAMPHTYKMMTQEKFVMVAILDKPIMWSSNEVQVILLMAIATKADENIERFYQITSGFMFNKQFVDKLIHNPTFDTLISIMESI